MISRTKTAFAVAAAAALCAVSAPAYAATIVNLTATNGGLVYAGQLQANTNLLEDAGIDGNSPNAYIFLESSKTTGTAVSGLTTTQVFLFHYDGLKNTVASGSFDIQLAGSGTNSVTLLPNKLQDLLSQDTTYGVSGVKYQPNGQRGLDGNDSFGLGTLSNNLQKISYDVIAQGNGKNLDEIRLMVTNSTPGVAVAVPEPATWGMMILGIGIMGGVMRRKPRQEVRHDFA